MVAASALSTCCKRSNKGGRVSGRRSPPEAGRQRWRWPGDAPSRRARRCPAAARRPVACPFHSRESSDSASGFLLRFLYLYTKYKFIMSLLDLTKLIDGYTSV